MRRRGLIVGTGIALSAFAGCLGEEQTARSERPPENAVEDGIRTAIGESNTVALELATAREDADSPAAIAIDAGELQSQLDGARGTLDETETAEAADDYAAEIEAARTYVGIVASILQGSVDLVAAATQLDGLESELGAGNYDAAGQELESIQPTVDDARSTTTEAQSTLEGLDAELLDPYGAKPAELTDGLASIAELTIGADELAGGYASVLTGQDHLEAGGTAFQQGEFDTAESEFQAAGDAFANATAQFQTARQETSSQLATQIDVALCRSTALEDAATRFENSAAAGAAGDLREAQTERQAGQSAVADAESCGS